MSKAIDYSARKYGRLQPLVFAYARLMPSGYSKRYWLCECDCGEEAVVWAAALQSGKTTSCGCARREMVAAKNRKHGMNRTPEHSAWLEMKRRCTNQNSKSFPRYGGRGILVCERWLESFQNFFDDVGLRPSDTHSLDRIDVNGNYEPGNVRWATREEQMNNLRKSIHVTVNGIERSVTQWSRLTGIHVQTMFDRINAGWDHVRAVTEPPRKW